MNPFFPTNSDQVDQLVSSLISTITEISGTSEGAHYWVAGVMDRLHRVDWEEQVRQRNALLRNWYEQTRKQQEERNNELVECELCGCQIRRADVVRLAAVPKYRYSDLCSVCAEPILSDYERLENITYVRVCQVCGNAYTAETPGDGTGLCKACNNSFHRKEFARLRTNLRRAQKLGLEASLTLTQWLATIENFSGLCAYCQTQPFQAMEHFKPINAGGGTTAANCIPVCSGCNSQKHLIHPDARDLPFRELHVQRVRDYLERRSR